MLPLLTTTVIATLHLAVEKEHISLSIILGKMLKSRF